MADSRNDSDLTEAAERREVRRRLDHHERHLAHLQLARFHLRQSFPDSESYLDEQLAESFSKLDALQADLPHSLRGRRRPSHPELVHRDEYLVFVDECGAHTLSRSAKDFGAFVLGAVIVRRDDYDAFQTRWVDWKRGTWGDELKKVHEPDVRRGTGPFWFNGDKTRREQALASLAETIEALDFLGIAVVIRRQAYLAEYGRERMDTTLPDDIYHMAINFLSERLVIALDADRNGGRGRLIVESRGPLEDAKFQHEFARLHIDGTAYVSSKWFRSQLFPGINFATKNDYLAGLEVADLLSRPCGEKVLDVRSTPARWPEFRTKFCQLTETAHSPVGIKVVPWTEDVSDFWKS